jgi:predicted component of type VI protein secretion system
VSQVIEPLKAKTAALVPDMAKHSNALRAVVAVRGYVDPSALVLKVRGLKALLDLRRALRLLFRGKINLFKTFLKRKTPASAAAAQYLGRGDVS